ncbi:unnamed protein product [Allacma fusca]|uniref:Uncharacterized protein n=1 Tax=Allacma fusca TaxID=39272 RepID=A0A8J2KWH9_9HEXA|nr:unnamed protein product [Allacma fusca]
MHLGKCRLVSRLFILLVISQVIQGIPTKSKSRNQKNTGNGNSTSFLKRVRRADDGLVKITKDSAAVDQVCTTLEPCEEAKGQAEEKLFESCIEFNPFDKEPSDDSVANEEKVKLCYNPDPAAKDPIAIYEKETVEMIAQTPKNLNDGYDGVGFAIPEKYVFRHLKEADIFKVNSNYEEKGELVDFQFLEWPGKTIGSLIQQQMAAQTISDVNKELGVVRECMQALEFDGKSDKYLDYLCNTDEGLDVAALGLIPRQSNPKDKDLPDTCPKEKVNLKTEYNDEGGIAWEEKYNRVYNLRCNLPRNRDNLASKCATWPIPEGKLYLAGGNTSLMGSYVQPLLVSEDILRKLVQPDELSLDGEKYVPQFVGKKLECTELMSRDIRTVLDFAFSSGRLILGMKCGVLLIKNINQDKLEFDVAYLRLTDRQRPRVNETNSHMFPYMINTIAASTCCSTDKMCHLYKPIVAIYSAYAAYISYPDSGADKTFETMPKFIYISTDNGDTFDRRVVASPRAELNLMYWMYAKIPKWQIKDARPPDWIKEHVIKNDLDGDNEEPVDPITSYLLQNSIPKVEDDDDDDDCYEIISMVVVSEESLLLILCRYNGTRFDENNVATEDPYTYGIFSIKIRGTLPLISAERRSKRKFQCTPVSSTRIWGEFLGTYRIEPTLVRVPNSYSIFVMGCRRILYYSSNGGRTMFISSFFASKIDEPPVKYERTYVNEELKKVPMIALDSQGQSVMITYGSNFAYGVISTNTQIAFVTGSVFEADIVALFEPVLIPFLNDAGKVGAAVIYINTLKQYYGELYADRHAIRLLDCSVSIHKFSLPYYGERNKDKDSHETITPCTTYNFKTNKTTMFLDVGESDAVKVSVMDTRKDTPLNILLTHDKAASLQVFDASEVHPGSDNLLLYHGWDIRVTAKPYIIPRTTAMVNAFFGASYSNLEEVSAHLIVSTAPQMRCHVQPRGHLQVRFGCRKRLVIHEDEYVEDGTLSTIIEYYLLLK